MALVPENGTGLANADSLISLTYFQERCAALGKSLVGYDATDKQEPAIRRGSTYINSLGWKGQKFKGRDQSQSWPRADATDRDGKQIPVTEVPIEVQQATVEASYYELTKGSLAPSVQSTARVRSVTVGPIRKDYARQSMTANDERPVLLAIHDLLVGMTKPSASQLAGASVRK